MVLGGLDGWKVGFSFYSLRGMRTDLPKRKDIILMILLHSLVISLFVHDLLSIVIIRPN